MNTIEKVICDSPRAQSAHSSGHRGTLRAATSDLTNPSAVFDNSLDRSVIGCVKELAPKWAGPVTNKEISHD